VSSILNAAWSIIIFYIDGGHIIVDAGLRGYTEKRLRTTELVSRIKHA